MAAVPRDWSKVTILPSDERWVAVEHADSNLRQMRAAFAGPAALVDAHGKAAPETGVEGIRWLSLVPPALEGAVDASYANRVLEVVDDAFDAILLGMGVDGHFGSLFPGAPNLARALDPANADAAVAIVPDPMPAAGAHPRISLTLARMLRSRRVLLAITGADKRAVLTRAQLAADPAQLPVAALLHAPGAQVDIHWSP
jgi:6-phosphogluconolactonase